MKSALILASLIASSANAFVPTGRSSSSSSKVVLQESKSDLIKIAEKSNPVIKFYDPLNLADADFWNFGNEATIGFLRHSEIKHGRIAMFAFVGYIVQSNFVFPWPQTISGDAHPAVTLGPEAQWDAIPLGAKWQIFAFISALELWDECGGGILSHYMKGRKPGQFPSFDLFRSNVHWIPDLYDPFGINKNMSEETKERRLISELNNGRLAMIGIFSFLTADKIQGSVPFLEPIAKAYSGDPMIPFEGQFSYFH